VTTAKRPIFGPEWPRYAIAAHVIFWLTSAVFLASCVAAFAGAQRPDRSFIMFVIWIVAGLLIGAAAMCSGKLYFGNQIFAREPTTGWSARLAGAFLFLCAAVLLYLGYAITHVRGA